MPIKSLIRRLPDPVKSALKTRVYPDLLTRGEPMPPWSLRSYDGSSRTAEKTRWSLLCFYPGDDTPGCTAQLQDLQTHLNRFQEAEVDVFGINPASADSHKAFAEKYGFEFPILTDTDGAVAELFGSLLKMPLKLVIVRTVYLIDPAGRIHLAQRGAPSAEELLHSIRLSKFQ